MIQIIGIQLATKHHKTNVYSLCMTKGKKTQGWKLLKLFGYAKDFFVNQDCE